MEATNLSMLYKLIDQRTYLLFSSLEDVSTQIRRKKRSRLPEDFLRKRMKLKENNESLLNEPANVTNNSSIIPKTVSPGYGELSRKSFGKLMSYLQNEVPQSVKMSEDSTFLDIGSGFGKCVFHAKLKCGVKKSVGIEYISVRAEKSKEILQELMSNEQMKGLLKGVEFLNEDATTFSQFSFSHVFAFDYIFTPHTQKKLIPIIEESPEIQIYISFIERRQLEKYGFSRRWKLLDILDLESTGKEVFRARIYARPPAKKTPEVKQPKASA